MIRHLFTCLLWAAVFSPCSAHAQTFSGGFFAGVTGTQVDGDKFAGYNKGGFTVGATAQYPLAPKFLAAIEIGFTQKGAQSKQLVSTSGPAFPNVYNLRINYVDLPLMIKFYDRHTFGLGVGAQYSRVVGNPKQYRDPFQLVNIRGVETFKDGDVSGIAEASYYFNPQWQLNVRFSYGWTPMGYSGDSDYRDFA
ncbi:MAG TPA: outer membrane beta-barrel protein, partial [Chitinophagales bacterium]|nr:outer membrane beta-barrel protein [Chitinophagales bacterium]